MTQAKREISIRLFLIAFVILLLICWLLIFIFKIKLGGVQPEMTQAKNDRFADYIKRNLVRIFVSWSFLLIGIGIMIEYYSSPWSYLGFMFLLVREIFNGWSKS